VLSFKKSLLPEYFLGLGLGLGYMTSLRLTGPVGFGELFVLVSMILLFARVGHLLFRFSYGFDGFIKFYLIISVALILPCSTLVTMYLTSHDAGQPQYIISFLMGVVLAFLVVTALIKDRFCPYTVVRTYALSFFSSFFISLVFFPRYFGLDRFVGFASDPNQLMFYVASLSLLLVLYEKTLFFLSLPILIFIGFLTGSDSYYLQLVIAFVFSFLFWVFFRSKNNFIYRSVTFLMLSFCFILFLCFLYGDLIFNFLVNLWRLADNGGHRISLMLNGFKASTFSPFIGNGAGAFSGVNDAFEGDEAHNTFLDYSSQFGFVFAFFIYIVFFGFVGKSLKNRNFLIAGFAVAFILSGIFHNNGRHFIFWFEFGLFFYYLFYYKSESAPSVSGNR
jgi:hypothetical protein